MYNAMYMIRKQIYLEDRQDALLKERARTLRTTESDLIRRAIDRALSEAGALASDAAWQRLVEAMAERSTIAAEAAPREWTREELYEERLRWPRR
jgi:hypothetical protein